MHNILVKQNDEELLELLKASNVAYNNAKSKEFIFSYVLIFLALAYPLLYIFIKNEEAKYFLFIISFLVTISTWILSDYFKGNTSKGALYKEKYDTDLFQLPWKFLLPIPKNIEVKKLAKNYKKQIVDWYPAEISEKISDLTAIAICQKVNSGWDIDLRIKYRAALIFSVSIYAVSIFVLWTLKSVDGRTVFSIYFSTLSFYTHIITLIKGNTAAINKRQKIVDKLDEYIDHKKEFQPENIRDIQDEIYNIRQEPSKVPDIFFHLYNAEITENFKEYVKGVNARYDKQ